MSLKHVAVILFFVIFSVPSYACADKSEVIEDLYKYIEFLDVKKVNGQLEKIRLECDISSERIKSHLLFGELTVADAKNDRAVIEKARNEIFEKKLIDTKDEYFAWKLYAVAQSYFWDGDVKRAVELLNQNKYYYDNNANRTIDIRLLALLGGFFSNANASLSEEKAYYLNLAESKAKQLGLKELMLFVYFRKGGEYLSGLSNGADKTSRTNHSNFLELVSSTEDCVTKAEVMITLAVNNIGGNDKSFQNFENAVKIFNNFGVTRSEIEALIWYVDVALNAGRIAVADDILLNALTLHQDKIEPRQRMKIYDLLFKSSQSKENYDDALNYKENYYKSALAAESSEARDTALAEYKIQEQTNRNQLLEQSVKILELERESQADRLYIITIAVLSLLVILLLTAYYFHKTYKLKNTLFEIAMIDQLTGAANRRAVLDSAFRELALAKRTKQNLTVILADLDNFKSINDKYGHATGDEVLKAFAQIAKSTLRNVDLFGRFGGEEWLFVLPSTDSNDAQNLFDRIAGQLRQLKFGELTDVTFSMGAVDSTTRECELDELIKDADQMLYRAKAAGRNQLVVMDRTHNSNSKSIQS